MKLPPSTLAQSINSINLTDTDSMFIKRHLHNFYHHVEIPSRLLIEAKNVTICFTKFIHDFITNKVIATQKILRDSPSKLYNADFLYHESYVLIIYVILQSYLLNHAVIMKVKIFAKDGLFQSTI